MKSTGPKPCIPDQSNRSARCGSVAMAMALIVAIVGVFLFPWLAGAPFGPSRTKDEADFSALRANPQLAARNDNKHIRDADRDDGKGGSPPDVSLYVIASVIDPEFGQPDADVRLPRLNEDVPAFYRGSQQPRAPPVNPS